MFLISSLHLAICREDSILYLSHITNVFFRIYLYHVTMLRSRFQVMMNIKNAWNSTPPQFLQLLQSSQSKNTWTVYTIHSGKKLKACAHMSFMYFQIQISACKIVEAVRAVFFTWGNFQNETKELLFTCIQVVSSLEPFFTALLNFAQCL